MPADGCIRQRSSATHARSDRCHDDWSRQLLCGGAVLGRRIMTPISRRQLLIRAAATGASLTVLRPLAALGATDAATPVSAGSDPGFAAGEVISLRTNGDLVLKGPDSELQTVRVAENLQTWKAGQWQQQIAVGDLVYARGDPDADGVLQVERLWANLVSFSGGVSASDGTQVVVDEVPGLPNLRLPTQRSVTITSNTELVHGTTVTTGTISELSVGEVVQVVAGIDTVDGTSVATRVIRLSDRIGRSNFRREAAVARTDGLYEYRGIASVFCNDASPSPEDGGNSSDALRPLSKVDSDRLEADWPVPAKGKPRTLLISDTDSPAQVETLIEDPGVIPSGLKPNLCTTFGTVSLALTPAAFSRIANLDQGIATVSVVGAAI